MDDLHLIKMLHGIQDVSVSGGTVKPWGREIKWADVEGCYTAKILHIKKGHKLSRQYHERKQETMLVLHGTLHIEYNDKLFKITEGKTIHIPKGVTHRPMAISEDVAIMEVSTWDDGDVVRLMDEYGRA